MPDMIIQIRAKGLKQMERHFMLRSDERVLNRETIRPGMDELGNDVAYTLQNYAPFRTGRLSDSIQPRAVRSISRPGVDVTVDARDDNGFNYLNVTRFGRRAVHAKDYRQGFREEAGRGRSRLARTLNDSRGSGVQKRPFRRMALRFEPGAPGSGFEYRHSVRSFRPSGGDWVKRAQGEVKQDANAAFAKIVNDIDYYVNHEGIVKTRKVSVRRTTRTGRLA